MERSEKISLADRLWEMADRLAVGEGAPLDGMDFNTVRTIVSHYNRLATPRRWSVKTIGTMTKLYRVS